MGLKAGIVGLPNVGKSTLFNAITKKNILAANYPFATIDPNIGVVTLPDPRLEFLENLYVPEKTVPTAYEFIDIAGLVQGAASGEGLGNKFLSHIREVDAVVEVIRCFDDSDIIHVEGQTDPIRDIEIINVELILADLEIVQNRILKIAKKAEVNKINAEIFEHLTLKKVEENLQKNIPLRNVEFTKEEQDILKSYAFITMKPIIYLANVSLEDAVIGHNEYTDKVSKYAESENASVIVMSAKIESELVELSDADKKVFLSEMGINYSGLDKLIFATYNLLGLQTFFTSGKDECRAWTFKKGMKAPECAGIIQSDFQRGFIKAEIMSFDHLQNYGSENKVKEAGKMRLEGKEYQMQDGDICYFRFNV